MPSLGSLIPQTSTGLRAHRQRSPRRRARACNGTCSGCVCSSIASSKAVSSNSQRERSGAHYHPRFGTEFGTDVLLTCQGAPALMRWRGMPLMKNVFDFAMYPALIAELRPRTIFEIGSGLGGSAAVVRRPSGDLRHRGPRPFGRPGQGRSRTSARQLSSRATARPGYVCLTRGFSAPRRIHGLSSRTPTTMWRR